MQRASWLSLASLLSIAVLVMTATATGNAAPFAASAPCTRDDVIRIFRETLGRDPENEGAITGRVGLPCDQVQQDIETSPEAIFRRVIFADPTLRLGQRI